MFDDEGDIDIFLSEVCNSEWNVKQDAGRALAEATAERVALFPEKKPLIEAFYDRWEEMLGGAIGETVDILRELKAKDETLYALTNWSGETFPIALQRFDFLHWFEGTLVSGDEKLAKPDPAIFHLLLNRYNLQAEDCLFIDDSKINIEAASRIGFETHHFTSAQELRQNLIHRNLL
jgi:2-haloacid dehalogenase